MASLSIDPDRCRRDGICATECPFGLITLPDGDNFPELRPAAKKMCISCGHCVAVCPHGALSLDTMLPEECSPPRKELAVSPEAMEQFLKNRRSIRAYRDKPVPRRTLERIIDAARWAPSARNKQPVHWLMVETPSEVRRLAGLVVEWLRAGNQCPGISAAWARGKDMILREAPHLAIAHAPTNGMKPAEDCIIAMTYLDLAAQAHGLGTCWAGYLMSCAAVYQPLIKALDLPAGHRLYGALMLGYPKFRYFRIPQRRPAKVQWR